MVLLGDARIAEVEYQAFLSKKDQTVTARPIVRRVHDLNKQATGPGVLLHAWRYHAVFTDPVEVVKPKTSTAATVLWTINVNLKVRGIVAGQQGRVNAHGATADRGWRRQAAARSG